MGGIFEVYVQTHFSAAHRLEGYPGDCSRTHGHNWIIEVFVRCSALNDIGHHLVICSFSSSSLTALR
jgi:6-pyruvoyltetrahydropterin/6-carboxytetrahydropterin synthase